MEKLSGRETQKQTLLNALQSYKSELISVIGRRRVGKTFLVRNVYKDQIIFELSGVHDSGMKSQLKNFSNALSEYSKINSKAKQPEDWIDAFEILKKHILSVRRNGKKVVFLDEFPWIETPRSGFLSSFEHFWNSWASKRDDLVVVICGSSASWMINKIIHNKGGLHNRITETIRLMPFTLKETELFFKDKHIYLDRYQISQLYMVMGGIPFYLNSIQKGESSTLYIDRLCFTKDGLLADEFTNLYHSLFHEAGRHIAIIKTLAKHPEGLTRDYILQSVGAISGGRLTATLTELEESGFISSFVPFGKTFGYKIFKLIDEFSFFSLKFIEQNHKNSGKDTWIKLSSGYSWKIWSGFAWERMCLKHTGQIKEALGIEGVMATTGIWRSRGNKIKPGAQIDLYIDRNDNCINVCETKYYNSEFVIDKNYSAILNNKINLFKAETGTNKTVFLTFITLRGVKKNQYSIGLIQNYLTVDSLFL